MTHVHIFELGKTDLTKKQINQIYQNMDELLVTFADGVVCP